jgi:uncharacterized SAM-dependent methyltransferase
VRHPGESRARDLSQFLPAGDALAVHRNAPGNLIILGSRNFLLEEARAILQNLGSQLQSGDALLLGTDMVKDASLLLAAYNDREEVTAQFNLNVLHRLNRELGAAFDLRNSGFTLAGILSSRASRCT